MDDGPAEFLAEFQSVGCKLSIAKLVSGSSGNLSIRLNGHLLITAHGSDLGRLKAPDIIEAAISSDESTPHASFELPVHREIYRITGAHAVVHAHPACAIALSAVDKAPLLAGFPFIGENVDIIPGVLAAEVASLLRTCLLVMVRGHGSFAAGETLEEALRHTLAFEDKCQKAFKTHGLKPQDTPGPK